MKKKEFYICVRENGFVYDLTEQEDGFSFFNEEEAKKCCISMNQFSEDEKLNRVYYYSEREY